MFCAGSRGRILGREIQLENSLVVEAALDVHAPELEARAVVVRLFFQPRFVTLDDFFVLQANEYRGVDIHLRGVAHKNLQAFWTHDRSDGHHAQQSLSGDSAGGERQFEGQRQRAGVCKVHVTEGAPSRIQHVAGQLAERDAFRR